MLTRIEAVSAQGVLLSLPLEDLDTGFLVEEVTGLDPVKATISSSSFAQLDGSQYQSARREERNITLRISLEPDYATETVRSLRKRLYSVFMPKSAVDLRFYLSDENPLWISGRVESCETALFTAEPAVDVSIICFDPDFYDPTDVTVAGASTASAVETLYTYDGSVETGITFTLNVNRSLSQFTIYHRLPSGSLEQMDFAADLVAGDVLKISTTAGAKSVILTRANTDSSLLYAISPQSSWLELQPGDNYIRVYAVDTAVPYTIEYVKKYGGL